MTVGILIKSAVLILSLRLIQRAKTRHLRGSDSGRCFLFFTSYPN